MCHSVLLSPLQGLLFNHKHTNRTAPSLSWAGIHGIIHIFTEKQCVYKHSYIEISHENSIQSTVKKCILKMPKSRQCSSTSKSAFTVQLKNSCLEKEDFVFVKLVTVVIMNTCNVAQVAIETFLPLMMFPLKISLILR